ncbi:MAG: OB-fold nucleic acid binding domain-containing protein, partial [Planctomycetota bacterium]
MGASDPQLTTPLRDVPGIGPARAEALARLGLTNVGRLIAHLPSRHEWLEAEARLADLEPETNVSFVGEVTSCRPVGYGRPRFEAVVMDETGRAELVWFNMPWLRGKIMPGLHLRVQGRAKSRAGTIQVANPRWSIVEPEEGDAPARERTLRAVYPAGDGVSSKDIAEAIECVLPWAPVQIDEHLPDAYRLEKAMPTLPEAYRMQHAPASDTEVDESRRRLAFDELLLLQLGVHMKRAERRATLRAPALKHGDAIDAHIRERLPYTLTPAQDKVVQ